VAATPILGNGYNVWNGRDALTQQKVEGLDGWGAGFGLVSDVAGAAALTAHVTGFNPTFRIAGPRMGYSGGCFVAGTLVIIADEVPADDSVADPTTDAGMSQWDLRLLSAGSALIVTALFTGFVVYDMRQAKLKREAQCAA